MKSKKKICFLIPTAESGGIETYLLRFLRYIEKDIDVTVLIRSNKKGVLLNEYEETGAKIVFKPLGYFNLRSMYWYFQFFRKEKFDTICDFNANFAGIPMLLGKITGAKKRITFYRQGSDHFKKSLVRLAYNSFLNRLVYYSSTDIFANSSSGLAFFFPKEYSQDNRFQVIKNGVNIDEFLKQNIVKKEIRNELNLPESNYIIGHTGRFTKEKNQYFLLEVAQKLVSLDSNICFVLIGKGTHELLAYVKELNIEANVIILGYKSNVSEYLKAFDMYFFPSITEGQPNALIEAMISGLPVAASNIPSIIECLPSESLDCLIDPYNVNETVDEIIKIKNSPENYIFQQHAIKNFDALQQFKIFRDLLFAKTEKK